MIKAVNLHFDYTARSIPQAVLVFPCLARHLLWVRHPVRGWEVPGGKIEVDETPLQAAHREVWEESGATLSSIEWVAEYVIPYPNQPQCKWVFVAHVNDVAARPLNSEIIDVRMLRPVPPPEACRTSPDISWVMKDAVYHSLWPTLQRHLGL